MEIEGFAADLAAIDWSASEIAWGNPPEGVPGDLIALARATDHDEGDAIYRRLDNSVVVQSRLYPAAELAVPFLIRLSDSGSGVARHFATELLIQIGLGEDPNDDDRARRCREGIAEGAAGYYRMLESPDAELQLGAIHLLEMVETDRPRLTEALRRRLDTGACRSVQDLIETVLSEELA